MADDPIHPEPTRKSGYRYTFTGKHHGGGSPGDARWNPDLSKDQEFSVFDDADFFAIADKDGWMYGVLGAGNGELLDLGTWQQQIAEFPQSNAGIPWHGYPIWAVNNGAPDNRRGEKMRPRKEVFDKLEQAGLITKQQRKRLYKGSHA
jgi:hypothetical protein